MKLTTAIKTLEQDGWAIQSDTGAVTYIASKGIRQIDFFVNPGSETTSRFTFSSDNSCAPTYGLSLRQAMNA